MLETRWLEEVVSFILSVFTFATLPCPDRVKIPRECFKRVTAEKGKICKRNGAGVWVHLLGRFGKCNGQRAPRNRRSRSTAQTGMRWLPYMNRVGFLHGHRF